MPVSTPSRPWHHWYGKALWLKRRDRQLSKHPLCAMCEQAGIVTAAKVVDHVIPHHGDYKLFWFGELQSLCEPHHNSTKKQLESKGYVNDIGVDGWPTDPNHIVYKTR